MTWTHDPAHTLTNPDLWTRWKDFFFFMGGRGDKNSNQGGWQYYDAQNPYQAGTPEEYWPGSSYPAVLHFHWVDSYTGEAMFNQYQIESSGKIYSCRQRAAVNGVNQGYYDESLNKVVMNVWTGVTSPWHIWLSDKDPAAFFITDGKIIISRFLSVKDGTRSSLTLAKGVYDWNTLTIPDQVFGHSMPYFDGDSRQSVADYTDYQYAGWPESSGSGGGAQYPGYLSGNIYSGPINLVESQITAFGLSLGQRAADTIIYVANNETPGSAVDFNDTSVVLSGGNYYIAMAGGITETSTLLDCGPVDPTPVLNQ